MALVWPFATPAAPALAQAAGAEVGTSVLSVNEVEQVAGQTAAPLPEGARVRFDSLLRTGAHSANKDILEDGTELTLGPRAEVRVDSFVYDPATGTGEAALTLVSGAMRWASGSMASENYRILTPTASIGIRGTGLVVAVTARQETVALVETGAITVTGSSQRSVDVGPGQFTVVDAQGVPSAPRDVTGTAGASVLGGLNTDLATLTPPRVTLPPITYETLASRASAARSRAAATPAAASRSFGGDGDAGSPPGQSDHPGRDAGATSRDSVSGGSGGGGSGGGTVGSL
ncbi:FecR family protein [Roseospirillum parvum]|uniref:FecR family protein n=1 Tax=Roseospirillum parvum TaxID=83401 RepID=UPI0015A1E932|nr:FecR family protein [Roseospirillum parvum]